MTKKLRFYALAIILLGSFMMLHHSCEKGNELACPQDDSTPQGNKNGFGAIPSSFEELNAIPLVDTLALNQSHKIYNVDFSLNMPPVKDQGNEGSCVAFATAYAARSYHLHRDLGFQTSYMENELLSPEFVYNIAKISDDCDSGMEVIDGLKHLSEIGVCTWKALPYTDGTCSTENWISYVYTEAECYKIDGFERVPFSSDNMIKQILTLGNPIVIAVNVDESIFWLEENTDELYDPSFVWNEQVGNWDDSVAHAMVISGWDDHKNAWKVMNSWGNNYGDNGYGWIDYDFLFDALLSASELDEIAYNMFILQTSPPFNCIIPYSIEIEENGGNNQTGNINTELALPIKVLIKDINGNAVKNTKVTFSELEGAIAFEEVFSDEYGLAINYWTLGATVGEQILTVTALQSEESFDHLHGSPITFKATAVDELRNQLKIINTNQIVDFNGLPFFNFNNYDDYCDNYRIIISFNYDDETPGANYIDLAFSSNSTTISDGIYNLYDDECEGIIIDFFHSDLFNSNDEYGEIINGTITVSNNSTLFEINGELIQVNDNTGSQLSLGAVTGRIVVE